jgi:hypothetical protein
VFGREPDARDLNDDGYHSGVNHLGEQLALVPLPEITQWD